MEDYLGNTINNNLDNLLTEHGKKLLEGYYYQYEDDTPQRVFARAAVNYSDDLKHAQRIYDYASTQLFMFSTPILANVGKSSKKGLPISCFVSHIPDKIEGIIEHLADTCWSFVVGGGVGADWSSVRSTDGKVSGPVSFLSSINSVVASYKQGKTRRGSYAAYLDISHPEIVEFITMRIPTGGDINRKNFNLFNAINITDDFMRAVKNGTDYDLIDPKTKKQTPTSARKIWEMILESRSRTGTPYLNFIDTINRSLPKEMKEKGLKIYSSNLCNEFHLPTDNDTAAVCCLASLNAEYPYKWTSRVVEDIVRFLDNVLESFIKNCPPELYKAKKGAIRDRPLGIGVMGFGSACRKMNFPFESSEAKEFNIQLFSKLKKYADMATFKLGKERGECPSMEGTGRRNSHLIAVAPTANISIIANCSPSIEPVVANAFITKMRTGMFLSKDKYLKGILGRQGLDTEKVWNSIMHNKGSIEHLNISMMSFDKESFKTAKEIDQLKVIEYAADRQKYICQGQSLNIFIPSGANKKYIHNIHYKAWELGCKGLYYYRGEAEERPEDISVLECSKCAS